MDVVLNWLWQGGVIALALAMILRLIPQSRTQVRYWALWAGCAAVLVLPAVPLLSVGAPGNDMPSSNAALVAVPFHWWTSTPTALALWAIWVVGYAARLAAAALRLRQARSQARSFPGDLEARLPHWARLRTSGRRARLMLSDRVRAAALLGGGTPVIAVSPTLLEQLDDLDLDRVVVHEWAHVQRRDDLAQIGELCVRLIAGWHPAVWWLERQLHLEREVACDELAADVTGSAKAYATCLLTLAALPPVRVRWVPSLAAVAPSTLRRRVSRIVASRPSPARSWRTGSIAAAAAVGALALLVGKLQVVETVLASPTGLRAVLANRTLTAPVVPRLFVASPTIREVRRGTVRPRARAEPALSRPRNVEESGDAPSTDDVPEAMSLALPVTVTVEEALDAPELVAVDASAAPSIPTLGGVGAAPEPPPAATWSAAGQAGSAIGAGSARAAVATAAFFTRVGKRVARSF
ncbi:MAG: M56 family metallopeptidase [Acidobacteria bacterium]|nr:M56 family metallopeptidase [Acidobacteriota bacterium]